MSELQRPNDANQLRETVAAGYAKIAETNAGCGCSCGDTSGKVSLSVGYDNDALATVPDGADMGLGCGAPVAWAALKPGETVLDLGSGPGMDAFLAAKEIGADGLVIGIDMTDAMLDKARDNATRGGYKNVEFRKGLIEDLPVDDASIDVILSNCVINLSPEKDRVFREAVRVLKPGGRMVISDIVLDEALPLEIASHLDATVGCVGNAVVRDEYLATAKQAGFTNVEILKEISYGEKIGHASPIIEAVARDTALTMEQVAEHMGKVRSITVRFTR